MRRRSIAAAATAGTLALGGAAVAVADGDGPFWGDPKEAEAEFAGDLASKLDGVSAGEVQNALRELREERRAQRRKELAGALATELEVSRADVEAALEKAERKLEAEVHRRFDEGRGPRLDVFRGPDAFIDTLARELGKERAEVRRAFEAVHREGFEAGLDEAVEEGRLTKEQADRIREHFDEGRPRFHGGFGPRGFVKPGPPGGPGIGIPVPPP
jgi:hypothetical protein